VDGYVCRHHGVPLPLDPFAQVFFTDRDMTSPPDAEGNRLITCRPISPLEEGRLHYRALQLIRKLRLPVP